MEKDYEKDAILYWKKSSKVRTIIYQIAGTSRRKEHQIFFEKPIEDPLQSFVEESLRKKKAANS